jgi:hypothetical protein
MLIKKVYVPEYATSLARIIINDYIIYLTNNSVLLGEQSTEQEALEGITITYIKIQEVKKNDIQAIDMHRLKNYYSTWVNNIRKYIVLTINNKYRIIWAAESKNTKLILPEELQQYLKQ